MPAPRPNPPTGGQQAPTLLPPALHPYPYQVAGHTTPDGAPGALGDGAGRFYKPLQAGVRGERERAFYEGVTRLAATSGGDGDSDGDDHPAGPFTVRAAPLLAALPRFHGVAAAGGPENTLFLVLEDVAAGYARPCLADIKVGARAWYPGASPADAAKWKAHDGAATQGVLGWKVCGMQVWRRRGEEGGREASSVSSSSTSAAGSRRRRRRRRGEGQGREAPSRSPSPAPAGPGQKQKHSRWQLRRRGPRRRRQRARAGLERQAGSGGLGVAGWEWRIPLPSALSSRFPLSPLPPSQRLEPHRQHLQQLRQPQQQKHQHQHQPQSSVHRGQHRRREPLPPFERKREEAGEV